MGEIIKAVENMLTMGDFVSVKNNSLKKEFGISKGDNVFITGSKALPYDEKDPYNLRLYMLVCLVVDEHVVSDKILVTDAKNFVKVDADRQAELTSILEGDFPQAEEQDNEATD